MINLQNLHKVALDTNIFICAFNEKDPRKEEARQIFEQIKENHLGTYISVLVLEEFFIRVYKQGQDKETASILDFISLNGLTNVLDVNKKIALLAAKLRAQYSSLRTPDAIHLASAIEAGVKVFITTDKRLPRKISKLIIKVLS